MNGPDNPSTARSALGTNLPVSTTDRSHRIGRAADAAARDSRRKQVARWGRSMVRTWGSLFRRPGNLAPTSGSRPDRAVRPARP